jgi:hypothetical protein
LYDATGGYALALGVASGALTVAAILYLTLREERLPAARAAAASVAAGPGPGSS